MAREVSVTASASKFGKMGRSIKASGRTTRRTEKAHSGMPMVTTTRANFAMINQMDTVCSTVQMAQCTRESGTMTSSTVQGKRIGLMAQATSDITWRAAATASALTNGQTAILIAVNGRTML